MHAYGRASRGRGGEPVDDVQRTIRTVGSITIPAQYGDGGIRTPGFVGQPARPAPVPGNIQGQNLIQFDYTPQQYAALSKLIAAFCTIFPKVPPTVPTQEH